MEFHSLVIILIIIIIIVAFLRYYPFVLNLICRSFPPLLSISPICLLSADLESPLQVSPELIGSFVLLLLKPQLYKSLLNLVILAFRLNSGRGVGVGRRISMSETLNGNVDWSTKVDTAP